MSDKIDFSFAFDLAAKQPDSAQAPELICIHPPLHKQRGYRHVSMPRFQLR